MAKRQIFSETALKKMRSSEHLDSMLSVTGSFSWAALAALGMIVLSVVVWSCFGALINKVEGLGMLIDGKGITRVISPNAGWVTAVNAEPGKKVGEYELLAVISSPEYLINEQQIKGKFEETQSEQDVKNQIASYSTNEISQMVAGNIISSSVGVVDELNVKVGDFVQSGSLVCTIANNTGNVGIKGVFYVSALEGKKIREGMTIQVTPSGFDKVDDGELLGIVRSVSQYPVSGEAIRSKLGNDVLTQAVLTKFENSVVAVDFDLIKDEGNASGYLWTVKRNSQRVPTSGSMVSGFVVTSRKPPIEKVFYKISNWLRTR
ncbi:MAG: HlyD family efflux transporter periplasmic adaptor subunit [Phascolarctobacterium sp.]|nr:HlyD family efflux transporter periplasmic adaptor subunit [Candidatus Phascolarctobacterium equi]